MTLKIKGVPVTVRFSLALLCALLPFLPGRLPPLLMLAIALHEAGHLFYILLMRLPLAGVVCSLSGVRITLRGDAHLTVGQTVVLNLAGPVMTLLAAATALLCNNTMQGYRFAAVSLAVAAATLIPCGNTDGAAALRSLFSRRLQKWVGIATGILCCGVCLWQGKLWGCAVGIYFFVAALVEEPT